MRIFQRLISAVLTLILLFNLHSIIFSTSNCENRFNQNRNNSFPTYNNKSTSSVFENSSLLYNNINQEQTSYSANVIPESNQCYIPMYERNVDKKQLHNNGKLTTRQFGNNHYPDMKYNCQTAT
eukprot:UN01349